MRLAPRPIPIPIPVGKILICILLAVMVIAPFAFIGSRSQAQPASGINLTSSTQVAFPNSITFQVKAQSDSTIIQLRLHYVVDQQNYATVVSEGWPQFTKATSVTTQWVWDMRKTGGLPPGAQVEYWWTAKDSSGASAQSQKATVSFDDTRFKWQSITTDPVTLLWYNGSQSFADALMSAAQQGLKTIQAHTGLVPQGHVKIYIYASVADLQSAQLFAQQWEGGVTFSGFNIIAIGVPTDQLAYGLRTVPHELTHWVVHQATFNAYGAGLPVWLDEGLATNSEGSVASDYQSALSNAIKNNQLLSIRSLSSPFSAVTSEALLSYAESQSVVAFMIRTYGADKMNQLLKVFAQGSEYDAALKQVYGFDQDGLDALWRQSLGLTVAFHFGQAPALALAAAAG